MPCMETCVFDSSVQSSAGAFTIPTWTPTLIVVPNGFSIVTALYPTPPWMPWPRPVSPWVPPTGLPGQTLVPGFPWPPYPGWPGPETGGSTPPPTTAGGSLSHSSTVSSGYEPESSSRRGKK